MFGGRLVPGANVTFVDSTRCELYLRRRQRPDQFDVIVTNPTV